ncbi:cob(I)yrinic acid a,c-diamide adenosyltransferase [Bacillota bacterium Meth-B3]
MKKGLTHIYTGDGKGKTSCAMGMALRAAGSGLAVNIFQFCKTEPSGELKALKLLPGVTLKRAQIDTHKFAWDMDAEEKARWSEAQQALFDEACEASEASEASEGALCGLVILDEVLGAVREGAIDEAQLSYLIGHKHKGVELVLTGRNASPALIAKADYVTEMRMVKHPYTEGIPARRGIEY